MFLPQCPSEGSFIAWKKVQGYIVKLEVCKDALRSSATTLKCRCSKAKVLAIENIDGSKSNEIKVYSNHDSTFMYEVGKIARVEDFDTDRWAECSAGIHFFIAREMAVKY
jgi:ribosomal protein S8